MISLQNNNISRYYLTNLVKFLLIINNINISYSILFLYTLLNDPTHFSVLGGRENVQPTTSRAQDPTPQNPNFQETLLLSFPFLISHFSKKTIYTLIP